MKIEHPSSYSPQSCLICKMRLPNDSYLEMHEAAEHRNGNYRCDQCNRNFASAKYFRNHMTQSWRHDEDAVSMKCPKCRKVSSSKRDAAFHQAKCLGDNSPDPMFFSCPGTNCIK